ncbi:MAG: VanZ family protein, partial [Ruminococcus sp.]|nr:VanZ family protein [Ruminococcus sp.]
SGVAFSVLIEVLHYAMSLGNAEIDDVICNTLGLLAGCLLYDLYRRYILHRAKKKE